MPYEHKIDKGLLIVRHCFNRDTVTRKQSTTANVKQGDCVKSNVYYAHESNFPEYLCTTDRDDLCIDEFISLSTIQIYRNYASP